jgi:ATP-dependent protease ClpP protease subunit
MKWQIKAKADGSEADIHINDFIGDWIDDYFGFGVTSRQFISELQNLPDSVRTVRLHINSPGGDAMAASHIANTIRDQHLHKGRSFEVLIEGAAWSAATIITSAGNPTKIADNAVMMIHNPWTVAVGNASELRKSAEVLDTVRDGIVAAYKWKSPLEQGELVELMDAETWMDADEAIERGFADEKISGVSAAAAFDIAKLPKKMRDVPEKYRERVQALLKPATDPAPNPSEQEAGSSQQQDNTAHGSSLTIDQIRAESEKRVKDILDLCTKAGVPEAASNFLDKGLSVDEVRARLADADKIRSRCVAAKLPDRANGYIIAGMTVNEVANEIFDVLLARQPDIDNHTRLERSNGGSATPPLLDQAAIYAKRNGKKS